MINPTCTDQSGCSLESSNMYHKYKERRDGHNQDAKYFIGTGMMPTIDHRCIRTAIIGINTAMMTRMMVVHAGKQHEVNARKDRKREY